MPKGKWNVNTAPRSVSGNWLRVGGRQQRRGKQGVRVLRAGERGEGGPLRPTEPSGVSLSRARGAAAALSVPARRPEELLFQELIFLAAEAGGRF